MLTSVRHRIKVEKPVVAKPQDCGNTGGKDLKKPIRESHFRFIYYFTLLVLIPLYTIAPLLPTLYNAASYLIFGDSSISNLQEIFAHGLYFDLVKDPTRAVFSDLLPTDLATSHDVFLQEYEDFRTAHILPSYKEVDEKVGIDPESKWKALYLRTFNRDTCAAKYFPRTLRRVAESTSVQVVTVMFSRVAPNQTVQSHVGPSKGIVRLLIGLKVPVVSSSLSPGGDGHHTIMDDTDNDNNDNNQHAYLKVWNCVHFPKWGSMDHPPCRPHVHQWHAAGQEFAFDDSFLHTSANPTNQERIALFLDIRRPDFRGWRERLINYFWIKAVQLLPVEEGTQRLHANMQQYCARAGLHV